MYLLIFKIIIKLIITSSWLDLGSNFPMVKCLDNCRIKLEMWNKSVFGQVGNNLTRLPKHLEWLELQCVMPEVIASMRETRVELNSWRDKAEAMWN